MSDSRNKKDKSASEETKLSNENKVDLADYHYFFKHSGIMGEQGLLDFLGTIDAAKLALASPTFFNSPKYKDKIDQLQNIFKAAIRNGDDKTIKEILEMTEDLVNYHSLFRNKGLMEEQGLLGYLGPIDAAKLALSSPTFFESPKYKAKVGQLKLECQNAIAKAIEKGDIETLKEILEMKIVDINTGFISLTHEEGHKYSVPPILYVSSFNSKNKR